MNADQINFIYGVLDLFKMKFVSHFEVDGEETDTTVVLKTTVVCKFTASSNIQSLLFFVFRSVYHQNNGRNCHSPVSLYYKQQYPAVHFLW